jgi:hypothetical protein
MPVLKIEIAKGSDGGGVLRCTREDGSVTWQKQKSTVAAFFAWHDATHYAVESVLRYKRGFFGLVAEGWNLEDTTGKGSRGPLPAEAVEVEFVVGTFDSERVQGLLMSAEEFNAQLRAAVADRGISPRDLTEQELCDVRACRSETYARWLSLEPGESFELMFGA